VFAEQAGLSPESGATSRIKTAYDWLVAKGANYGATDAADWSNNWGSMWNRIMESAAWEPDGTATEADVASTKTFYAGNGDRTIKTGTAPPAIDWSTFSLQDYDDCRGNEDCTGNPDEDEDTIAEESTWLNTAGSAITGVWRDSRTGLYWSADQGSMTNLFTRTQTNPGVYDCPFFDSSPRGAYTGGDADCGVAINYCAALDLVSGGSSNTDWYLPSQKELMIAYINGMYNQTDPDFTIGPDWNYFWSSTELSGEPTYAWLMWVDNGYTVYTIKANGFSVRCVRRD